MLTGSQNVCLSVCLSNWIPQGLPACLPFCLYEVMKYMLVASTNSALSVYPIICPRLSFLHTSVWHSIILLVCFWTVHSFYPSWCSSVRSNKRRQGNQWNWHSFFYKLNARNSHNSKSAPVVILVMFSTDSVTAIGTIRIVTSHGREPWLGGKMSILSLLVHGQTFVNYHVAELSFRTGEERRSVRKSP